MKLDLRYLLFVDTEATCWGDCTPEEQRKKREIIEIGIVKVDNVKKCIVDKESYLIKNIHSDVSEYCTNLTGISQTLIDMDGVPLGRARKQIMNRFGSKNRNWFAWGQFDESFLKDQCEKQGVEYFMSPCFINMSALYSLYMGQTRAGGMGKAMARLNIEMNGPRHRALPDAEATAEIYLKIMRGSREC